MKSSWLYAVLLGGATLLFLSACSDSTSVGLGVGPDSLRGGEPITLDIPPTLDTTRTSPITGTNFRQTPSRSTWRFLVGVVDDPIPGTGVIEAEGYVDFAGRSALPSAIRDAPDADSLSAELRLRTTYLHGRPEEPVEVKVYDLMAEAEMDSARAPASFDADETESVAVDTATFVPRDSLITIELRESWINEHLETLKDTTDSGGGFENNFPGFKIVAPNSQAVVGFSASSATLRLTYEPDTTNADYAGLKTFTHIEQRNVTASPPNTHRLLLGGVGVNLTMDWAYGEEEFARDETTIDSLPANTGQVLPLNRAEIFVPVDTLAMDDFSESSFVRPRPMGFRMVATRSAEDIPSCAVIFRSRELAVGDRGCEVPLTPSAAPGAALVSDNFAFPVFQESFRRVREGQSPLFTTYRVQVADRETIPGNALSTTQLGLPSTVPVLIQRPSSSQEEPGPPRATLTVTPL